MSPRQKKAASHDAPGSTIMAQSRVRIPPESTSDRVFRQTPRFLKHLIVSLDELKPVVAKTDTDYPLYSNDLSPSNEEVISLRPLVRQDKPG